MYLQEIKTIGTAQIEVVSATWIPHIRKNIILMPLSVPSKKDVVNLKQCIKATLDKLFFYNLEMYPIYFQIY